MNFNELSLIEPILSALETEGYTQPTPIQEQAIPHVLAKKDLLGCAQTGTGKTAAFAIPMLQNLHGQPKPTAKPYPIRALILTPTRELALQILESFQAYGRNTKLSFQVIFGGVGQKPQTDALRRGTDILVATPGRLLDLMNQGFVSLGNIEIFVLDEADRMLNMGFIHDVKKVIAKLPKQRQTLFFSATMPPEIASLANSILTNPVKISVTPVSSTAEKVEQSVYFVEKNEKRHLLIHLLQDPEIRSALVFTRTKHGANKVAKDLNMAGIKADAIHGNKSQNARQDALAKFKTGRNRVLVATDIAARGIDVEELSHVINFELPNIPETYVHRIGRTGRAGKSGIALSFCESDEVAYLRDIQRLIGMKVPVAEMAKFSAPTPEIPMPSAARNGARNENSGRKPSPTVEKPSPSVAIGLPEAKPEKKVSPEKQRRGENSSPSKPDTTMKNKPDRAPLQEVREKKNFTPKFQKDEAAETARKPKARREREPLNISKPASKWDFLSKRVEVNVELDDFHPEDGDMKPRPIQSPAPAEKQQNQRQNRGNQRPQQNPQSGQRPQQQRPQQNQNVQRPQQDSEGRRPQQQRPPQNQNAQKPQQNAENQRPQQQRPPQNQNAQRPPQQPRPQQVSGEAMPEMEGGEQKKRNKNRRWRNRNKEQST